MTYTELLPRLKLTDTDVLNVYQYGSRCYGNNTPHSDWDFIVITRNKQPHDQFSDNLVDVSYYTVEEFQDRLNRHEISAIECYFLPTEKVWKIKYIFSFRLDKQALRQSLSTKSSHSVVKAKKKLTIEADYDDRVGKKSLFHAFRIIEFGIQLATHGSITNYAVCNELYTDIIQYTSWSDLFETYKKQYNQLISVFRIVAPK